MSAAHDNESSILFDIVDMLARDRRSGSQRGLSHYLARFPGYEEDVAREYLQVHDSPQSGRAETSPPGTSSPDARAAPPARDSETGFLKSSGTPFSEHLRRLAAPILRGTHFRREEEIARGGMGIIHRVRDVELDRTLALKEMILGPADEHALAAARFLEEAQVTAQLDHPGIVPIHEVGLNAEGHLYFAMKLVRGRDLRAILELARDGREGWNQPRMLGVLLKVCDAMAYAHSKGVIHRDLKPGNVMVGHFGEVYVMDWGLARAMGRTDVHDIRLKLGDETKSLRTERRDEREETPDSPLVTMDGVVVGTPAYMSPEQARGEIQLLSPRSDVYSIGAMMYHLLTGQTPYVPSGARLSKHTVLARVIQGPPPALEELVPRVSPELVAICEKAMAREPERRYRDTLALGEDLRAYLEGRVVRAHETGALAELRKWVRRNKGIAVTSAAAIVALVGGFATSSRLYVRATEKSTEVLRLSALQELDDLTAEVDTHWPLQPESAGKLERWLDRARRLLASLPEHEQKLASMGPSTNEEERWWRNQLTKLVSETKALADPATGLIAGLSPTHGWGVQRRFDFARSIRERSVDGAEAADRWREAIASIRDREVCPKYDGLELAPQLGLLPIGRDPDSGLWEFAHLHSGEPARRGPDGKLVLEDGTGIVLVLIPGGRFWMGAQSTDPDGRNFMPWAGEFELPLDEVSLDPFFLSKYELTQSQWSRFAGHNPSEHLVSSSESGNGSLLPVEQVNWMQCDALTRRLGLTLPTEAQWEYAARAGTETTWWTGNQRESIAGTANVCDSSWNRESGETGGYVDWLDDGAGWTSPVGIYRANPFGLHDVGGNVAEWCREVPESYTVGHRQGDGELNYEPRENQTRIIRGGSWQELPRSAACGQRALAREEAISWDLGLRPSRPVSE